MSQNNGNGTVATIPNAPYDPRYTGEELKNLRPADYRKVVELLAEPREQVTIRQIADICHVDRRTVAAVERRGRCRSEEHTSELQSHSDLVCRLLLEKKKKRAK